MGKEKPIIYDVNEDGRLTDSDLTLAERKIHLENIDEKEEAQKKMAWYSLYGVLLYPILVAWLFVFDMKEAGDAVAGMAPTYFGSVAVIVAAYFAKEGYVKTRT